METSRRQKTWRLLEGSSPREGVRALCLSLQPCPVHFSSVLIVMNQETCFSVLFKSDASKLNMLNKGSVGLGRCLSS